MSSGNKVNVFYKTNGKALVSLDDYNDANLEIVRLQSELASLKSQLEKAEEVIEAARKLKHTLNYLPVADALIAYDQFKQQLK